MQLIDKHNIEIIDIVVYLIIKVWNQRRQIISFWRPISTSEKQYINLTLH